MGKRDLNTASLYWRASRNFVRLLLQAKLNREVRAHTAPYIFRFFHANSLTKHLLWPPKHLLYLDISDLHIGLSSLPHEHGWGISQIWDAKFWNDVPLLQLEPFCSQGLWHGYVGRNKKVTNAYIANLFMKQHHPDLGSSVILVVDRLEVDDSTVCWASWRRHMMDGDNVSVVGGTADFVKNVVNHRSDISLHFLCFRITSRPMKKIPFSAGSGGHLLIFHCLLRGSAYQNSSGFHQFSSPGSLGTWLCLPELLLHYCIIDFLSMVPAAV